MRYIKLLFAMVFICGVCTLSAQQSSNITLETEVLQALGMTMDIKVVGNLAFISGSERVLMCFDVTSPAAPQLLSSAYRSDSMPVNPYYGGYGKLLLLGSYAYFHLGNNTVAICDISNPNHITWLNTTVQITGFSSQETVSGDRLYLAGSPQNSISIWNIANPLDPQILGSYTFLHGVYDVQVAGNYAYVSHWDLDPEYLNISILDISNPAIPVLISTAGGGGGQLLYYNGYIYAILPHSDHFDVLDVRNPLLPVWGNPISIPELTSNTDWLIDSGILYLRCEEIQEESRSFYPLARYDLSNPAAPVELAPFTCPYAYMGRFDVENNRLFLTDEYRQIIIYAPSNSSSMQKVGEIQRNSILNAQQVNGYLYLDNGSIVDCSQPASQPHYFAANHALTSDGNSLFSAKLTRIYKWNLSEPELPVQVANAELWMPNSDYAGPLSIVGDYLYSNRRIINTNLDYSSVIINNEIGDPKKIVTSGNYAYAAYHDGLRIFEVSDPTNPQPVNTLNVPSGIADIHISGNALFIAPCGTGLRIYHLSNPTLPTLIVSKPNVIGIKSLTTSGHYLLTAGSQGIQIYKIYDLAAPVPTGNYYQEGKQYWDMEVVGEQIFVCQGSHLGVYNISAAQSNPDTPELPQAIVSISSYPNPFIGTTTITISGKEDEHPCELAIYNLKGQLVKTLLNQEMLAGTHRVIWDGKDGQGRAVSSGVYFYRMSMPNKVLTNKMLLLK